MKLVYSQEAIDDLVRLREFIGQHDPQTASRLAAELVSRMDSLRAFPQMGRPVAQAPEPDAIRDFVFGNYVVRYAAHPSVLVVLRIWHHFENRQGAG